MKKIQAIILSNEWEDDHLLWLKACEFYKNQLDYRVVNLTKNTWLEQIQSKLFDILLAKPSGVTSSFKQLYDERIYILHKVLGYPIFPSAHEIYIYENKRFLSFWLKANNIPHPKTDVFYERKEAEEYLTNQCFPIVGKVNIGASGSGVRIIADVQEASIYVKQAFSRKGVSRRWGPNLGKSGVLKRGVHYLFHPSDIIKKAKLFQIKRQETQNGFVIFQEYIHHEFEWRVVRIGDSFFAHKKLKSKDKASGSLLKNYDNPPLALLDFVKAITDKHSFFTQAVDVFESSRGYLVNEMQCIFGQSDPYQMLVNDIPGRYLWKKNSWIFEPGAFNSNESYNLRVEYIINSLKDKKL